MEDKVETQAQEQEEKQEQTAHVGVETDDVEEAKVKTGITESAGMDDAQKIEVEESDEEVVPSFFVDEDDEDRYRAEVDVCVNPDTKRIVGVSRIGLGIDFENMKPLVHFREWFEFSIPSYDDVSTYRQRSLRFWREAQRALVDNSQLRSFLLTWHLKDWSLRDKQGEKIELEFDKDNPNRLSDECIAKVFSVKPPTLLDVVLTMFEKDVILT